MDRARPATERHSRGVETLGRMMKVWVSRSGLSHAELAAISAWGLGEDGFIDKSVISRIKNGKQERGAGLRHMDALAAANYAIWLWQTKGQPAAWDELGPHTAWGVQDGWLKDATWLPHPDDADQPLRFADLVEVVAGYLKVPDLTPQLSASDADQFNRELPELLDEVIADQGWGVREGIRQLMAAYPVEDAKRKGKLRAVILGDEQYSGDELEMELHALAEMIRVVRELKAGSYGPAELTAELRTGRRPVS